MRFLFFFAVTGWVLGLIAHLLSLAQIDVTDKVPIVWILHLGVFVVWIPMSKYVKKNDESKEYQKLSMLARLNPFNFFKIFFKNTPSWLVITAIAGFIYAMINFELFIKSLTSFPDIVDGQIILQDHKQVPKIIIDEEYHHYKANLLRGFSGHWIAFYGLAMAMLFPFNKQVESNLKLRA